MKICGFNKTTLLDYPGRVACTIFLGGCNFRCPFCQNSSLVLAPEKEPAYEEEEILKFLKKRKGILDGVCVSGGEPMVKALAKEGLVDKVAVDIKACPDNYKTLTGLDNPDVDAVKETVEFLMKGKLDYEFRTTVVRELHTERDFREIGQWLKGAKAYYLQAYRDSEGVLKPGFGSYSLEELKGFREILLETIPLVEIRGID